MNDHRPPQPIWNTSCFVDDDTPVQIIGTHLIIGRLDRGHITIGCHSGDELDGLAEFAQRIHKTIKEAKWRRLVAGPQTHPITAANQP